jgi:hypothetical protein
MRLRKDVGTPINVQKNVQIFRKQSTLCQKNLSGLLKKLRKKIDKFYKLDAIKLIDRESKQFQWIV